MDATEALRNGGPAAAEPSVLDLILSADPAVRNRSLDAVLEPMSVGELLATAASLEDFRQGLRRRLLLDFGQCLSSQRLKRSFVACGRRLRVGLLKASKCLTTAGANR